MEFKLFTISCKNKECNHEFVSNSLEHNNCPACGAETTISDDFLIVESKYSFKHNIGEYIKDKVSAIIGIVIATAHINNEDTLATYDDIYGFNLNIKTSINTTAFLRKLGINSLDELKLLIQDNLNAHESLITDPEFDFLERESYSDHYNNLHESGKIKASISKKIYNWILDNLEYVNNLINQ